MARRFPLSTAVCVSVCRWRVAEAKGRGQRNGRKTTKHIGKYARAMGAAPDKVLIFCQRIVCSKEQGLKQEYTLELNVTETVL